MSYAETSRAAWHQVQPKLTEKQRAFMLLVYKHFPHSSFTDKELCEAINSESWPINCITPRRGECLTKGYLRKLTIRRAKSMVFEINAPVQMELIAA